MSGHNKWSQIKGQKGVTDKKRSLLFSKLLAAIAIAAKQNPSPEANPRLRSAIEKAKENQVPLENIERAVSKAKEQKNLEEVVVEAYGPESVAMIIEGITDNINRTISEIKHLLAENGAKFAEQGSVLWAFEKTGDGWKAKFPQNVSPEIKQKIDALIEKLEEHNGVQRVITNANF